MLEIYGRKYSNQVIQLMWTIELTLEDETIILNAGDSFSFSSQIPHKLRNPGDEEAIMISTMTPVRISW